MVLVDVHAGLLGALEGDARAGKLRQAVDIVGLDAQRVLDILAHFLAPCLSAEDAGFQRNLIRSHAHLLHRFAEICRVGRGAAQNRGLQILDEHDLALGIAGGGRDGQAADLMAAAVETGAAGEQAVAVGNLADVLICAAGCDDGAGAAVFPQVDIVLRVEGDDALARRAGGGLNAHAFFLRFAHQAVGIGEAKVVLGEERQLVQIGGTLDVLGRNALFFHLLAVIGYIVPYMLHLLDQALILQRFELFNGCAFDFRLIVTSHSILSFDSCLGVGRSFPRDAMQ